MKRKLDLNVSQCLNGFREQQEKLQMESGINGFNVNNSKAVREQLYTNLTDFKEELQTLEAAGPGDLAAAFDVIAEGDVQNQLDNQTNDPLLWKLTLLHRSNLLGFEKAVIKLKNKIDAKTLQLDTANFQADAVRWKADFDSTELHHLNDLLSSVENCRVDFVSNQRIAEFLDEQKSRKDAYLQAKKVSQESYETHMVAGESNKNDNAEARELGLYGLRREFEFLLDKNMHLFGFVPALPGL